MWLIRKKCIYLIKAISVATIRQILFVCTFTLFSFLSIYVIPKTTTKEFQVRTLFAYIYLAIREIERVREREREREKTRRGIFFSSNQEIITPQRKTTQKQKRSRLMFSTLKTSAVFLWHVTWALAFIVSYQTFVVLSCWLRLLVSINCDAISSFNSQFKRFRLPPPPSSLTLSRQISHPLDGRAPSWLFYPDGNGIIKTSPVLFDRRSLAPLSAGKTLKQLIQTNQGILQNNTCGKFS